MKKRTNIVWSTLLSIVMVLLLVVQPHAIHAASSGQTRVVQDTTHVSSIEVGSESSPEGVVDPEVVPLLAPVAAYVFNTTVINSIFAASLGFYVGYEAQSIFKESINDKHYASSARYEITGTAVFNEEFPIDVEGIQVADKGSKHIKQEAVLEIHNRIKQWSNDSNYRVYKSTKKPHQTMYVIDINSSLLTTVNRHLANFIDGPRYGKMEDLNIKNENLDLMGYSIFVITGRDTPKGPDKRITHAHFTPQYLRDREIEYMRYRGEFNHQTRPVDVRNDKYLQGENWSSNLANARNNRGLQLDTKGNRSVVPYK